MTQKWKRLSYTQGYDSYFKFEGKRLEVKKDDVFYVKTGNTVFKKCITTTMVHHYRGTGGQDESLSEMTAYAKTQKGFSIVLEAGFMLRKDEKESKKLRTDAAKKKLEKARAKLKKEEEALKKRLDKKNRELKKLDS